MNYQVLKKIVPNRFRRGIKSKLLQAIAFKTLPLTGFNQYKAALKDKYKKVKSNDLISIKLTNDVSFFLRPRYTDIDIFEQIFLIKDCQLPIDIEPKLIIDAGAHIGCSAIFYSLMYPNAKIYAIELSPSNFDVLVENSKQVKNVIPINAAIWNKSIDLEILNPSDDGWSFKAGVVSKESKGSIKIKGIRIEEILEMSRAERINLIKIDIEGAEKEIFARDSNAWINKVDNMIIELHDRFVPGCTLNFNSSLRNYNYASHDTTFNKVCTNIRRVND